MEPGPWTRVVIVAVCEQTNRVTLGFVKVCTKGRPWVFGIEGEPWGFGTKGRPWVFDIPAQIKVRNRKYCQG